ncbi:DegT/DnrJ/EryC1/StrS family aminotransferase [Virgibacillus sp. W0430]|uniref:DegT/DnrJ/EryC1/StrS family aminotransferase n=1 Tax=Virgibacillus sp. W0430 TaxID=3391580 RepID=UPI003F44FFFE
MTLSLNRNFIPHNQPTLGEEETKAAKNVVTSGWLAQGKEVKKFEDEVCAFLGISRDCAVAVSSGTAALYLSLWALDIVGESVAFPGYVCSAIRNAVFLAGGKEILVDTHKDHPNVNLDQLLNTGSKFGVVPHMFGTPQDLTEYYNDTLLIEDCAQALGARVNGRPIGLQAEIGIFSFYATKMITSGGQGGMIVSTNKRVIDKIKDYRHFDEIRDKNPRFNFQMTDLQAAIGRVQLSKLPAIIKRREEIYEQYKQAGIKLLDKTEKHVQPVRYRAVMCTNKQEKVIKTLWNNNIMAAIPVQKKEILIQGSHLKHAVQWAERTVSLPIYPMLGDKEVKKIINVVLSVE